jgi:meso-butanediol dehydrogenase/(S,S)-butanediol dehydrogenase/diacetyl reductase
VCVADVNLDGCNQVVERIRSAGGQAIAARLDVTQREQITAAVKATVEAFGSINVMLNNAGINKPMMFLDVTEENWQKIMNVNALGVLLCMQEAAKQMIVQGKDQGPYKIINVGSILSRQAFDDVISYSCSKHAVLALINGGAKALVGHNITVNGYGPGVVRTELWEQLDKDLVKIGKFEKEGQSMDELAEKMILMKRYSYPKDVVGTATFLASAESDYMTGQLLMIDGGIVMQ